MVTFRSAHLAPTFAGHEVTPLEQFPLNSYLVDDPDVDGQPLTRGHGAPLRLVMPTKLGYTVFGGFRLTRIWHFGAMCGLVAFVPGHLVMVLLHGWSNFASMWTGSQPVQSDAAANP